MKLAYSKPQLFEFETRVTFQDGVIKVRWNEGTLDTHLCGCSTNPTIEITEDLIRQYVGQRELSDATNLYILTNEDGNFVAIRSKMAQSFLTKQSGFEYAKQNKLVIVGQIYIPFSDTPFEEWTLRLNFKPEQALPEEFTGAEQVGTSLQEFHDFAYRQFPSLRVVSQIPVAQGEKITVQLTQNGQDINKPGVRVFAKSASGYVAKREAYTDENGQVSFVAIPLGLESGDSMTPEFGFKWVTNIARTNVAA